MSLRDEFTKAKQAVEGFVAVSPAGPARAYMQDLAEALANLAGQWPEDSSGKLENDGSGTLTWSP